MLTTNPAEKIKGIKRTAMLKKNAEADIVIARKLASNYWDSFYQLNPSDLLVVIKSGKVVMVSQEVANHFNLQNCKLIEAMNGKFYVPTQLVNPIGEHPLDFEPSFHVKLKG